MGIVFTVDCSYSYMATANLLFLGGDFDDDCMLNNVNGFEAFGWPVLIQDCIWSDDDVISGESAD